MIKLPKISIVIATKDRPGDLADLLLGITGQSYMPCDVIIIDDSVSNSAREIFDSFSSKFSSSSSKIKYFFGGRDGLTAARNMGVQASEGEAILFLDDDTLVNKNVIETIAAFLADNPSTMGIQPNIVSLKIENVEGTSSKFLNAFQKALMMSYNAKDESRVRRSGSLVFPQPLTKMISAQRFSGCCCCYKREVFDFLSFDTNLKKYCYAEDVDFSYRAYKKYPGALYIAPDFRVIHKTSTESRLPMKSGVYMRTLYLSYLFFKNIFNSSILNLAAFLCALNGDLIVTVGVLLLKRRPKREWWPFIYLIGSYLIAIKNLKSLMMGRLEFFNSSLKAKGNVDAT